MPNHLTLSVPLYFRTYSGLQWTAGSPVERVFLSAGSASRPADQHGIWAQSEEKEEEGR